MKLNIPRKGHRLLWVLILLTTFQLAAIAQMATTHYIPPLFGKDPSHVDDHYMFITTSSVTPVNVVIRDSENTILATATVDSSQSAEIDLGNGYNAFGVIREEQLNTVLTANEGLIVEAEAPIGVQIRHIAGSFFLPLHALLLTSKGEYALGTRFRAGTAYSTGTHDDRADFISVMATEDNTVVNYSAFSPGLTLIGTGIVPVFNVPLNKGEAYVIASHPNQSNNLFLNGTLITSSKPIVTNVGSWSNGFSSFNQDISAEMTYPIEHIGTEYILMGVGGHPDIERAIVVADAGGTEVFLNNNPVSVANLNAGQYYIIPENAYSANNNLYLTTSKPAYVYQTTGEERYQGDFTVVSPLDCWGVEQVIIPRNNDHFDESESKVNILARTTTSINYNGAILTGGLAVTGNPDWVTYSENFINGSDLSISGDDFFQVGIALRGFAHGAATYFSEFIELDTMLDITLCQGESFNLNGNFYEETGSYSDTLVSVHGCDSIVYLDLTVSDLVPSSLVLNICQGDTISIGENDYTSSGLYLDTITTTDGCDSLIQLNLSVNPSYSDTISLVFCSGYVFDPFPFPFENDTIVSLNNLTSFGCDSNTVFNVTVPPSYYIEQEATICEGEVFNVFDSNYSVQGVYVDTILTLEFCDSIVVTDLTVLHHLGEDIFLDLCEGDFYNGSIYISDTTWVDSLLSVEGCDSFITTNIFIKPIKEEELSIMICPGETYNGTAYFSDEFFIDTLISDNGCDSLVNTTISIQSFAASDTLYLNIGDLFNGNPIFNDTLILENYTTASGCDSSISSQIFINPILTTNQELDICYGGIYQGVPYFGDTILTSTYSSNVTGADSIVSTIISILPTYNDTIPISICQGQGLFVGGAFQTQSGSYEDYYQSIDFCDSLVVTNLEVLNFSLDSVLVTLCDGEPYLGEFYSNDTILVETLMNSLLCDSVVLTFISVNSSILTLDTVYIETGNPFNGVIYNMDALVTEPFDAYNGCDSIAQTQIIVYDNFIQIDTFDLCFGETYNGNIYTSDTLLIPEIIETFADTIFYTQILTNSLNFNLAPYYLCFGDSVFVGGEWQYASGLFSDTYMASNGCDSIVFSNVIIQQELVSELDSTLCLGTPLNGVVYEIDSLVVDTLTAFSGCDSLVYTDLTVNPVFNFLDTAYVTEGNLYNGELFMEDTLLLNIQMTTEGCDSILETQIILLPNFYSFDTINLCEGETYLNMPIDMDSMIVDTLVAFSGSDSFHTTLIYVIPTIFTDTSFTICQGDSLFANGQFQTVPGIYSDTMTSLLFGCDSIHSIELNTVTEFFYSYNDTICNGSSVQLGNSSYNTSGSFMETLVAGGGCDSIVTLNLFVEPAIGTAIDTTICLGTSFSYLGETYSSSTTITEVFTATDGCDSTVNINLTVEALQFAEITGAAVICAGEYLTLSGGDFSIYEWSNGASSPSIDIDEPGTYALTVTNAMGCISSTSVLVPDPIQIQTEFSVVQPSCFGTIDATIVIDTTYGSIEPYTFAIDNGPFNSDSIFTNIPEGNYTLYIQDGNGCVIEEPIVVLNPPELVVDLGDDINILLGETVNLQAQPNNVIDSIVWSPIDQLDCIDCLDPVASPVDDAYYTITVYDNFGCTDTDDIFINVDNTPRTFVPNMFTPNADGINDYFTVYSNNGAETIRKFSIYNRWGGIVFDKSNISPNVETLGWDGRSGGNYVNPGVYIFYIEILFIDGSIEVIEGDITVIR